MKLYTVAFVLNGYYEEEREISLQAKNKADAYDKAVFEVIPENEGKCPYCARVKSVTYNNGNTKEFNTIFGDPY